MLVSVLLSPGRSTVTNYDSPSPQLGYPLGRWQLKVPQLGGLTETGVFPLHVTYIELDRYYEV